MRSHHLSVTTLEEHEPNPEFVGRNFNNGEIIQLVLKRRDGGWLPFRQVQMVLMHELAHNVQMNHSKAFWAERNKFAADLKGLWGKGYTGDGLWGSGRSLADMGIREGNAVQIGDGAVGVESLCGGTYRSRRRKRKRRAGGREELTWREKKDRRIEKKFGKNGLALGEDEDKRLMLELGKKGPMGGKPKVANSKRGRELRAAAALKRFGQAQAEEGMKEEQNESEGSDAEEYEEDDSAQGEAARDRKGQRLLDNMGFTMTRVCGDEDANDVNVKQEQEELEGLGDVAPQTSDADGRDELESKQATVALKMRSPARPAESGRQSRPLVVGISDDESTSRRVKELYQIPRYRGPSAAPPGENSPTSPTNHSLHTQLSVLHETQASPSKNQKHQEQKPKPSASTLSSTNVKREPALEREPGIIKSEAKPMKVDPAVVPKVESSTSTFHSTTPSSHCICPICSLQNLFSAPVCEVCSNVLQPSKVRGSWLCNSRVGIHCMGTESRYVHPGDAAYCCNCGSKREEGIIVEVKAEDR
ncbi:MAG: hypothetical protein Q9227_007988 [Pyrenula ochraceoflavens]